MRGESVAIHRVEIRKKFETVISNLPSYERERFQDFGFMAAMINVLPCNYAQGILCRLFTPHTVIYIFPVS